MRLPIGPTTLAASAAALLTQGLDAADAMPFAQTLRPGLDYRSAAKIRDTCLQWAGARKLRVAIIVLEPHAMPVTLAHMDGVSVAGGEIAQWKAVSAAKFGRTTADTAALNPPANMPNVATLQGGVPIYSPDGTLLGGVGVSGGKPAEDAACATAGIEAAGLRTSKPSPSTQ
ncbi:heme-binding protein [Sphingomonas psychrotolerans]|uniref:Heme-binding protein n=1 Tax=Sphingomonas psychrotolerans TaxID=1327635 RepID=A0ABU3N6U3_9SPHN|nr:heme-binding protein [Sphingomonas psychrotolerans]MDT8760188.1 heme-binding protein [Sphingomonas psychrotolerans]